MPSPHALPDMLILLAIIALVGGVVLADPVVATSEVLLRVAPSQQCGAGARGRHRVYCTRASPGLLSLFARPSVKDTRKSFSRDFTVSRCLPQFGGEFEHFPIG